jgi:outer membrane biosynthesis protein TonB
VKSAELLFKWPHRHRIHLLLPGMLILAALAHAGIFFLFSVANPPVKADGINPARVYFLGEGSPEFAQLESTLASNDPALFAPRHGSSAYRESIATYVPQYASAKTALLNMPPRVKTPETSPPLPAPVPITKPQRQHAATGTRIDSNRFSASPELASRLPAAPEGILLPTGPAPDSLESASFFVGVRSDGTVAHILPNRSSGDTGLDTQALQILKSLRFAPADETPLAWGFVDFHFGSSPPPPVTP